MGYRFHTGVPLGDEVHRVVLEQFAAARGALTAKKVSPAERAHRARVACKRIRAALRLIHERHPRRADRADRFCRKIGHQLADLRESGALSDAIDALQERWGDKVDRRTFAAARRVLAARGRATLPADAAVQKTLVKLAARLREAEVRLADRGFAGKDFSTVASGLSETYRRARRAYQRVRANDSVARFHDWRKRTKAHAYHAHLFHHAWPALMKKTELLQSQLGDLLGEEHDLALLHDQLAASVAAGEPAPFPTLLALIEERRTELRSEAIALGRRVFAEKPNAFVRRWWNWWNTAPGNAAS
jgi:CHAD domain-containing protein